MSEKRKSVIWAIAISFPLMVFFAYQSFGIAHSPLIIFYVPLAFLGAFCEAIPVCGESDAVFNVLGLLAMFAGYYILIRLIRFVAHAIKRT